MKKKLFGIFAVVLLTITLAACNRNDGVNPVIVSWIESNPHIASNLENDVNGVASVDVEAGIGNEIIITMHIDEETTAIFDEASDDIDISELFAETLERSSSAYVETATIAKEGLRIDYLRLIVAMVDANDIELARISVYAD